MTCGNYAMLSYANVIIRNHVQEHQLSYAVLHLALDIVS